MKKIIKRVAAALLAAVMVLGVAGCGKTGKTAEIDKNTIYKEAVFDLPFPENCYINNVSAGGQKIFFSGNSYDPVTYESEYFISTCNTDGSGYVSTTVPSGGEGHSMYIESIYATQDGNALIVYSDYFEDSSDPDNYVWESNMMLGKADNTGNIISSVSLKNSLGLDYVERLNILPDGTIFLYSGNTLYKIDDNGNLIQKKEVGDNIYIGNTFTFKDGSVGISYWSDDGRDVIKRLDTNTLELGDEITFPFSISSYSILSGDKNYDLILRNSGSIYGYNLGDAGLTEIINMINSDINTSYFQYFQLLDDNSYIGYYTDYASDVSTPVVAKYTKIDPKDYVEKEVIVLGAEYIDSNVRSAVVAFNKKNDKYRITIKDYSQYNTEDNYSAGYDKLNSDIASGQAPDIVVASTSSQISNYASKGLFVDLHKFLDSDTAVNKNDIWPNLITACETDGKLYQLVPMFYIQTLAGKKSKLGDRRGWTIDEMIAFEQSLPSGCTLFERGMARENFVSTMLYIQSGDFIDYSKATCNFDSDEFKGILKYASKLPKNDEMEWDDGYYNDYSSSWRDDRVVLYNWYISEASSYQETLKGYIGEDMTIIGFPTKDGSNGSVMSFYSSFAISSKSKHQEGAWEFVKSFWDDDYQSKLTWGIPASKSHFEEQCKSSMERPSYVDYETGETIYYDNTWWSGDTQVTLEPLTQAEVDDFINFIGSVTKTSGNLNEEIIEIITDESESFFNGQKSVDDVTTIIQNRITTYLREKQ